MKKKNAPEFSLTRPCNDCPFRTDNGFILRTGRVQEICNSLLAGQSFHCHKTTQHGEDGETVPCRTEKHCAGAMILLERIDRPSQMMRIGERLGMYHRETLDMAAPVFKTPAEMIKAYRARNKENGKRAIFG